MFFLVFAFTSILCKFFISDMKVRVRLGGKCRSYNNNNSSRCRMQYHETPEINGATAIAEKIFNVMQIAWNEWLFNYFSLVIYYCFGNLFLYRLLSLDLSFPIKKKPAQEKRWFLFSRSS